MAISRSAKWTAAGAGVLVALVAAAMSTGMLKNHLVALFTPDYVPVASAKAPSGRIRLQRVADGLKQPTDLQFVPSKPKWLVATEKGGTARLVDLGVEGVAKPTALVLSVSVRTDSELGLLGLAFHPDYAKNGRLFVNYTPSDGARRTVVSEWSLPFDKVGQRPAKEVRTIIEITQPYINHNAGQLAFGPDGKLYIGVGDGGWKNDPHGNGQDLSTLLGTMLRIDVDPSGKAPYGIPRDNPFVGRKDVRPEIWAYGLRNPWRYCFDPHGRLIVADVGQDRYEEIDIVERGANLGWNIREGMHCFSPKTGCETKGLVDPIFEYDRSLGTSITGGYVATSSSTPSIRDQYIFGDFTSGRIWALSLPSPHLPKKGPAKARMVGQWPYLISTFGRDAEGAIYLADYNDGAVYRLRER